MTRRFFRFKGFPQTGLPYPRARGPFLETPGNLSGPKSSIHSEIKRLKAWVLASKLLHFISLTDRFILLDANLLKPLSCMQTTTVLRALWLSGLSRLAASMQFNTTAAKQVKVVHCSLFQWRFTKMVPLPSKMVYKVRGWSSRQILPVWNVVEFRFPTPHRAESELFLNGHLPNRTPRVVPCHRTWERVGFNHFLTL